MKYKGKEIELKEMKSKIFLCEQCVLFYECVGKEMEKSPPCNPKDKKVFKLVTEMKDIDPDFSSMVDQHFWDSIEEDED